MRVFSRALVLAWNFSPDCVKPVEERQRFLPHEHIHVSFSYRVASIFSTDVHVPLAAFLLNTFVRSKCEITSQGDSLMTQFVVDVWQQISKSLQMAGCPNSFNTF